MIQGISSLSNRLNQPSNQSTQLLGQKSEIDFLELIKSPRHKQRIEEAKKLEKRIRLHTVGTPDNTTSYDDFKQKIKHYIDKTKYDIFCELIGEPVPTLSLTETIFDELSKVYEASNPSEKFVFNPSIDQEVEAGKFTEYFNHNKFFKSEYYNQLKTSPNSFIIVDTKLELKDNKQQPIVYFVDISNIIDVESDRDGNVNYIMFYADNDRKRIVAIDRTAYYVYLSEGNEWSLAQGFPSEHNLLDAKGEPFTPAFMLYPNFLNASDNVVVNSPLTKSVGDLEWLLFWAVAKRHLDSYASFPIYVSLEEDCTYISPLGTHCENGYVKEQVGELSDDEYRYTPCPECSKNRMLGAGTTITVKAPQDKDDPNNLNAVNVIPAEANSVKYVTEEKTRLEQEIYYSVLGKTSQPLETFSQSVAQLDLSTESRKAVLIRTKEIIESVHQKVVYTMAKLMYGDKFISFYKNYGDNYFLTTPEQEAEKYKKLKDTGAPESMLHATLTRLIATTYKTSPTTAKLQEIYLEVEPHQTKSVEQVQKLFGAGLISRKDTIAKIYFTDFIEEYESENKALVNLAMTSNSTTKESLVKQIKVKLYEFVDKIVKELDSDQQKLMDQEIKKAEQMPDLAKPESVNKRKYREQPES